MTDRQDAGGSQPSGSRVIRDLFKTARPRQWTKNVLVFAAPGAAGVLGHPAELGRAIATFALFCMAAGGTYFLNDAADADADRLHPTKRNRPIAAGRISVGLAYGAGIALLVASIALSLLVTPRLAEVTAAYVVITLGYTFWLKREPVLDVGAVAAGFILRAIAGGIATGVPLSNWFLIVTSFGSLFMVAGKRYAEYASLGEARAEHRATLAEYSLSYLRYMRSVSSSVTIASYCLWAFEKAATSRHASIWFELSIAPFVLAIFRYALVLDGGGGGAPEEVILSDRAIELLGFVWAVLFGIGIYVH